MRRENGLGLRQGHATGETCLSLTTTCASIATGCLTARRKLLLVTVPAPCTDVLEALHVEGYFACEVTFCRELLHERTEETFLCLGELLCLRIWINLRFLQNRLRKRTTNALDRRESDRDALVTR